MKLSSLMSVVAVSAMVAFPVVAKSVGKSVHQSKDLVSVGAKGQFVLFYADGEQLVIKRCEDNRKPLNREDCLKQVGPELRIPEETFVRLAKQALGLGVGDKEGVVRAAHTAIAQDYATKQEKIANLIGIREDFGIEAADPQLFETLVAERDGIVKSLEARKLKIENIETTEKLLASILKAVKDQNVFSFRAISGENRSAFDFLRTVYDLGNWGALSSHRFAGEKIVSIIYRGDGRAFGVKTDKQFFIMDTDGKVLFSQASEVAGVFAWAPNGKMLLGCRVVNNQDDLARDPCALFTLQADGTYSFSGVAMIYERPSLYFISAVIAVNDTTFRLLAESAPSLNAGRTHSLVQVTILGTQALPPAFFPGLLPVNGQKVLRNGTKVAMLTNVDEKTSVLNVVRDGAVVEKHVIARTESITMPSGNFGIFTAAAGLEPDWAKLDRQLIETGKDAKKIPVTAMGVSADDSMLAVGYADGLVVIVDRVNFATITSFQAHEKKVSELAWSQDGRRLMSMSVEDTANMVRTWERSFTP